MCVRVTFFYDIALPSGKTAALIPQNDDPLYVLAVASFLSSSLSLSLYLSHSLAMSFLSYRVLLWRTTTKLIPDIERPCLL